MAPQTTAAAGGIVFGGVDLLVMASPHGTATGVYAATAGDLDAFGPRGVTVRAEPEPEFARALAARWGRPLLDGPVDHGIAVPLRLLPALDVPVVAVAFAEGLGAAAARDEAGGLAGALGAATGTIAFVASANTSAGLADRAPLPSLPGAAEAEAAILAALREDPAGITAHLAALERAGSCAAGPLAAFAALFAGRPCTLPAYEQPFGVGYPVALTT